MASAIATVWQISAGGYVDANIYSGLGTRKRGTVLPNAPCLINEVTAKKY
ncbi:MAG: hypothetical protein V7K68_21610 [Nostoc sp.]